jgi:O-antigen/teichoic acid export membrane protein
LVFNVFLFAVAFIFRKPILTFLNLDIRYDFLLYLLPLASFLFSSYQILNYYLVRYKRYKSISINKVSRRISEGIGHTGLGFAGFFHSGLIAGNIIGHAVNLFSGIIQVLKSDFSLRLFSWNKQRKMLWKYREFPSYNLIPALLNAVCMHLPIILVNKFYTGETAAFFDLSRQVLVLPASILSLSISQVMLQNIAEKRRKRESFISDIYRIMLLLAGLGVTMIVIFSIWAPTLFGIYAGEAYQRSGDFARILVAGAALKLVVSPMSSVFAPLGQIKKVSFWHTFYFLMILSLSLFKNLDIMVFLKIYLAFDLFAYSILLIMIIWVSKNYEKKIPENIV